MEHKAASAQASIMFHAVCSWL